VRTALLVSFVAIGLALLPAAAAVTVLFGLLPSGLQLPAVPAEPAMLANWLAMPVLALAIRTERGHDRSAVPLG